MNNLKKLIFFTLIVGSQLEIHTAQESRKRKSERLEQVHCKKMIRAKETHDPAYQSYFEHVDTIVKNLPILNEGFQLVGKGEQGLTEFFYAHYPPQIGKETRQDNLNIMDEFPEIIAQAEKVIQEDERIETVFIDALWKFSSRSYPNPKSNLIEHENPMVRYVMKHPIFMRPATQKWVDKPNYKMHPDSLLCMAAVINHAKMALMLIDHMGADVNRQHRGSKTPLHYAIEYNKPDIIKILIETFGINVHLQDFDLQPALHKVLKLNLKDRETIIDVFIQAKADMQSKDKNGNTLLHFLARESYHYGPIIKKIISSPLFDINIQNNEGSTVLHCAVFGDYHLTNVLLDGNPNLNIQDNNGNTPLHLHNAYKLSFTKLIDAGADLNIKNNDGNTPLHLAVLKQYLAKIWMLLGVGADRTIMNNNFKTAEELATSSTTLNVFTEFDAENIIDNEFNEA